VELNPKELAFTVGFSRNNIFVLAVEENLISRPEDADEYQKHEEAPHIRKLEWN
jgi:hypothetical protein